MKQQDWTTFPFVSQWLPEVKRLEEYWPKVTEYDLTTDWNAFVNSHLEWDNFKLLRFFRQSRLAYLAVQDTQINDHLQTLHRISELAEFLVKQALMMAQQQLTERIGVVKDSNGTTVPFVILALGKLGTRELNYSSDIDLVFVAGGSGNSDGIRSINSERYFEKLGRLLIKLLDHFTIDGRAYRVDMRLRPFGSASPLVSTSVSLQHYITTEGRTWERFAWMRARVVAGCHMLGTEILKAITPFIYRRHLDYSVFDALAHVKREMQAVAHFCSDDIKLGTGGIRELEFIVQSLQATFGGRHTQLQGVSIAPQFANLIATPNLPDVNASQLEKAWLFLRRLENLCQLVGDEQTHHIPDDVKVREHIAQLMGFKDWTCCKMTWNTHREVVSQQFKSLFELTDAENRLSDDQLLWLDQIMRRHFENKMPQIREDQMKALIERALELTTPQILNDRLLPILLAIMKRPSYITMMLQEPCLLSRLLSLLNESPLFGNMFKQQPALLELLFDPEPVPDKVDRQWIEDAWYQTPIIEDEEQWIEHIRFFKQQQQFKLIEHFKNQADVLFHGFSLLAECLINWVVERAWHDVVKRKGSAGLELNDLMVIAYGSLGAKHMSINSDLDLVFVIDLDELTPDQQIFIQRWVKRISHLLTVKTYHDILYKLDLQLRPNGNAGALVTSRAEFEHYQKHQAWFWEHAALIKARILNGNNSQKEWFNTLRTAVLTMKRDAQKVAIDINTMIKKLQHFDLQNQKAELSLLKEILIHAAEKPKLLIFNNYFQLLEQAHDEKLIDNNQLIHLKTIKAPI